MAKFLDCVNQESPEVLLKRDMEMSAKFQLKGTPAFAVGKVDTAGRVTILKFIEGAQPFELFNKTITSLLSPSGS